MDAGLFVRGAILGFTIAAAVGPISLLAIRRTLATGWATGLASGLGVASADGIYGGVAAFGLTAVSDALVNVSRPLGLLGGAFLVVLGIRTLRSEPPTTATAAGDSRGLLAAYGSILGLTLTNPMTILSFAALFVGLGVKGAGGPDAALLTAGVFCGSLAWWLVLTGTVSLLRARVTPRVLRWVNTVSGAVIATFGVVAVAASVRG